MLGLLVVLLLLALLFGAFGSGEGWGYYGWSPLGLIILVILVLFLVGAVHAEGLDLAPTAAGGGAFMLLTRPGRYGSPGEETDQAGPPGLPYVVSYWLGVAIWILIALIGWIVTEYTAGHGADLPFQLGTPQNFAIVSMVAVVLGILRGLFPNAQHTPTFRRRELLHARGGWLPRDLHHLAPGGEPPAH